MKTPAPPRRGQGLSSTVRRFATYCAPMMSSPSPRTQRKYGVSFSVANFLANSSETVGLLVGPLAIQCSLRAGFEATLAGKALRSTPGHGAEHAKKLCCSGLWAPWVTPCAATPARLPSAPLPLLLSRLHMH